MYIDYPEVPSKKYFWGLAINLCLGCWNAGMVLGGNTTVGGILAVQLDWTRADRANTSMSSIAVLGLMLGSIFSKPLLDFGLRRLILISNLGMTLVTIPNFFMNNFYWLTISRFILGLFSAVIINATATFIGDSIPKAYQTNVGTVINTGIVLGLFVTAAFDLALPDTTDTSIENH